MHHIEAQRGGTAHPLISWRLLEPRCRDAARRIAGRVDWDLLAVLLFAWLAYGIAHRYVLGARYALLASYVEYASGYDLVELPSAFTALALGLVWYIWRQRQQHRRMLAQIAAAEAQLALLDARLRQAVGGRPEPQLELAYD